MSSRTRTSWFLMYLGTVATWLISFLCDSPSEAGVGWHFNGGIDRVALHDICDSPVCLSLTQPPNATGVKRQTSPEVLRELRDSDLVCHNHLLGTQTLKSWEGKFWLKTGMSQINKMLWIFRPCPSPFSCFYNTVFISISYGYRT